MPIQVLLIDGHKTVREGLATLLERQADIQVAACARTLAEAIDVARTFQPGLVLVDWAGDESSDCRNVSELLESVPDARVLAMSLDKDWYHATRALDSGAHGYVLKDRLFEELAEAILTVTGGGTYLSPAVRQKQSILGELNKANAESASGPTAEMICRMVEMRDPFIAHHQRRVAELSSAIAKDLGLSAGEVELIRNAALVHDVGKMSVPAEVLARPAALGSSETRLVRGHSEAGYLLLKEGSVAQPIPELVYEHHERCDGSGYPRGLTAEETLFGAKMLAVADVVEAMASPRPYRPSLGLGRALEEIESGAGIFYDEQVVVSCLHLFRNQHFSFSRG